MTLTSTQRNLVYCVLVAVNAAAMALSQQGMVSGFLAQGCQALTFLTAMFMHALGTSDSVSGGGSVPGSGK